MFSGKQLKTIRQKHQMSQESLGQKLGVNKMTISNWEKGKDIPVGRECPKSGDYLVEKKIRGGGKQVVCSSESCDYKEEKIK